MHFPRRLGAITAVRTRQARRVTADRELTELLIWYRTSCAAGTPPILPLPARPLRRFAMKGLRSLKIKLPPQLRRLVRSVIPGG